MLTLKQAAEKVGLSKTTVFNAIKSGKLSATRNDLGNFAIDEAELFRVYGEHNRSIEQQRTVDDEQITPDLTAVLKHLLKRERIERERERAHFVEQLERERQQLEREREAADHWRKQATWLLSHQPEPVRPEPGQKTESLLHKKLFGISNP